MAKKKKNIQKRQEVKLTVKRADDLRTEVRGRKLEKMWKSVDMHGFWAKVTQKVSKDADAYRIARAKSKGQAASVVFISNTWQKAVPYLKSVGF